MVGCGYSEGTLLNAFERLCGRLRDVKAKARLKVLRGLYDEKAYSDVVREAQERAAQACIPLPDDL